MTGSVLSVNVQVDLFQVVVLFFMLAHSVYYVNRWWQYKKEREAVREAFAMTRQAVLDALTLSEFASKFEERLLARNDRGIWQNFMDQFPQLILTLQTAITQNRQPYPNQNWRGQQNAPVPAAE